MAGPPSETLTHSLCPLPQKPVPHRRVSRLIIEIERIDARTIGQLLYFFEKGCGISGYILGVNPFDQPGVEAYKKNMFALLDKPGYEEESKAIKARL